MPTFTAIALDRLLEPGAPKSMTAAKNVPDTRIERRNSTPTSRLDRGVSVPPKLEKVSSLPNSKTNRKKGTSAVAADRMNQWTHISPALYATPKSTPIPDSPTSPSSFPPSPYIINHKRRGPRLLKSYSVDDVATSERHLDEQKEHGSAKGLETKVANSDDKPISRSKVDPAIRDDPTTLHSPDKEKHENCTPHSDLEMHVNGTSPVIELENGTCSFVKQENVNGHRVEDIQGCEMINGSANQNDTGKSVSFSDRVSEVEDFLDPQDSMSVKSCSESDDIGGSERPINLTTPVAEFYDAWEELSSENGPQQQVSDIEAELREIRLSLLLEIEKRKQAEDALNTMRIQWQRIRGQLSSVGLTLPADPVAVPENDQLKDPGEELCRQVYLARFVSNSIGRGIAKAEAEKEMDAKLELKNFEIARLLDRLHYYEAVNLEMSQRNQEAVDIARRLRQRRKRKLRWVWGSIAAAITVGSVVLAWSYTSSGKGIPSSSQSRTLKGDHTSEH